MFFTYNDLPDNCRVCIYGTGKRGKDFFTLLNRVRPDVEVVCFLDSFCDGNLFEIEIINFDNIDEVQRDYDLILIASHFWVDIIESLEKRSIGNYKVISPVMADYSQTYCAILAKNTFDFFVNESEIVAIRENKDKVRDLLTYQEDKELYRLIIDVKLGIEEPQKLIKYSISNYSNATEQYFDYINRSVIKTVIEAGVFDAFTMCFCFDKFKNLNKIYGFDPFDGYIQDDSFYSCIDKTKINISSKALWNSTGQLGFIESGASSLLVEDVNTVGAKLVNTISIDDFVFENKVDKIDFIKLDVEGAELEALKGAKETLIKHRPQLAVSIYHKNQDLYEIPLFLDGILKDYTYRLGHYMPIFKETLWYAIPNELVSKHDS